MKAKMQRRAGRTGSPGRKRMPDADGMQAAELRRNGYTRPSGGTKRTQASDLNRDSKTQGGS